MTFKSEFGSYKLEEKSMNAKYATDWYPVERFVNLNWAIEMAMDMNERESSKELENCYRVVRSDGVELFFIRNEGEKR